MVNKKEKNNSVSCASPTRGTPIYCFLKKKERPFAGKIWRICAETNSVLFLSPTPTSQNHSIPFRRFDADRRRSVVVGSGKDLSFFHSGYLGYAVAFRIAAGRPGIYHGRQKRERRSRSTDQFVSRFHCFTGWIAELRLQHVQPRFERLRSRRWIIPADRSECFPYPNDSSDPRASFARHGKMRYSAGFDLQIRRSFGRRMANHAHSSAPGI